MKIADTAKMVFGPDGVLTTINGMSLEEFDRHQKEALAFQEAMSYEDQIAYLKTYKKSVFTFWMEDGTWKVAGDSESDRAEMEVFFAEYPQIGVKRIEFHD